MRNDLKKISFFRKIRALLPEGLSEHYKDYVYFRKLIKESEKLTGSQWEAFQVEKLKSVIRLCWEQIEGYREHWDAAGFHPDHFKSLDDITRIPVITKDIIRQSPSSFTNPHKISRVLQTTGGSTGIPFQFYEPSNAGIIEKAFMHELWSGFYPQVSLKTK